jgi:hypothetical protein
MHIGQNEPLENLHLYIYMCYDFLAGVCGRPISMVLLCLIQ